MCPRYSPQRAVIFEIGEGDEFRDIDPIGASRFRIGDIGEPSPFSVTAKSPITASPIR
jgi:hypothetical protein